MGACLSLIVSLLWLDDPYYYLYFGKAARPRSYFSLECELPEIGRVIRFDSVSKILSSGIRIGFICAPEPILDRINMHVCMPVFFYFRPVRGSVIDWKCNTDCSCKPTDTRAHPDDRIRATQFLGI